MDRVDRKMTYVKNLKGFNCYNQNAKSKVVSSSTEQPRKNNNSLNDTKTLNRVNNFLQKLPGGLNYKAPRSCPWLTAQTQDDMNTYCIYECTDGSTKTITQISGSYCM